MFNSDIISPFHFGSYFGNTINKYCSSSVRESRDIVVALQLPCYPVLLLHCPATKKHRFAITVTLLPCLVPAPSRSQETPIWHYIYVTTHLTFFFIVAQHINFFWQYSYHSTVSCSYTRSEQMATTSLYLDRSLS